MTCHVSSTCCSSFSGHGGGSLLKHRCSVCCHCCLAFLRAILAASPAIYHTLDCHPAKLSSRLACSPRHLVCLSRSWPSLQAANAIAMVCHWHLRLQDERLLLTRAWCLIPSQHSGVTHKSTNHATFTCCSSLTETAQDFGFRVSVGLGGAALGFFR